MALEYTSVLNFPNEILHKILLVPFDKEKNNFVLQTKDIINASKLSDNIRNFLNPERTSYLFDAVFKIIRDRIPDKDIFKSRRACKRWKCTLDMYLQQERYIGRNKRFNPYEVLGIETRSSIADARSAAINKIRVAHPDKGGSLHESVNILLAKKILTRRNYRNCFRDSHKSPIHLKEAWGLYERAVAREEELE